jgi:hypothetical protein
VDLLWEAHGTRSGYPYWRGANLDGTQQSRIRIPLAQTVVAHREFTENASHIELVQIRSGASTDNSMQWIRTSNTRSV